jgi:photosystem II stability/assembly factor-like uncharacterized protein
MDISKISRRISPTWPRARAAITALLLLSALRPDSLHAQWEQTQGIDGGVVYNVAVSGRSVMAATVCGLFLSTDKGATWTQLGPVGSLVALRSSGSLFYAGCGDTVYQYNEQGMLLRASCMQFAYYYVDLIAIAGMDIFAASWGGGFFHSTDNGTTWTRAWGPNYATDLTTSDANFFCGDARGLYQSTDRGITWVLVNTGLPDPQITCLGATGNTLWAGVYNFGLYKSTDKGQSWQKMSYPGGVPGIIVTRGADLFVGNGTNPVRTQPADNYAFIPPDNTVFVSKDQGTSWSQITPADNPVTSFVYSDSSLFAGTAIGVIRSDDDGKTWTGPLHSGMTALSVSSIANVGTTLLAGTSEKIWWWSAPIPPAFQKGLYKSVDGGKHWTRAGLTGTNIESIVVIPNRDGSEHAFAGTGHGVLRSTDHGETWSLPSSDLDSLGLSSVAGLDDQLFASTHSGVYRSADRGASWTKVLDGWYGSGVVYTAAGVVYYSDFFSTNRSTDGGNNWTMMRPPHPGLHYVQRATNLGSLIFITTDISAVNMANEGLFRSSDNGKTWLSIVNGVTGTVAGLKVLDGALFAETYQGDVLISTDAGDSFRSIGAGLPRANAESNYYVRVRVFASDNYLFAAGDGIGVWRRPLSDLFDQVDPLPPRSYYLEQNFPNPFNAGTTIEFANPETGPVSLKVYNVLGQQVAVLIDNETRTTGYYSLAWRASGLPSGVYIYKLQTGQVTEMRKALLLK